MISEDTSVSVDLFQMFYPSFRYSILKTNSAGFTCVGGIDVLTSLSGHTLRPTAHCVFFCLATLLNLPPEHLPDVILLDEPELGLHPLAIAKIGAMIKVLSADKQVIVATQSPLLVDAFCVDELFVLEMEQGKTATRKLHVDQFQPWLDDGVSPGDLWRKSLFGGMALIRIGIVVEGLTEVEFIKKVVAPRYYENNCFFQISNLGGNIDNHSLIL